MCGRLRDAGLPRPVVPVLGATMPGAVLRVGVLVLSWRLVFSAEFMVGVCVAHRPCSGAKWLSGPG